MGNDFAIKDTPNTSFFHKELVIRLHEIMAWAHLRMHAFQGVD